MVASAKYSEDHVQDLIRRLNDPLADDHPQVEQEIRQIINSPEVCKEQSTWSWTRHIVEIFFPHLL